MLISTHDVDFAYRWAERAIVFCEGKIIADGTPLEIFQNEETLKKANLKKPMMLEVYESLIENNIIKDEKIYPKNMQEFQKMLQEMK